MAAICHLSLGELKAGQSLWEPHGVGLVRRSIAAVGYHGDREARAQGSLQTAKGSCWEL